MAGDISPNFPSLASTGHLSLGEESLLSTGEHDPEFVNQADAERFMCPVHHGLLHEPRQTTCGHRLCLSCIPTLLAGELSCRCPVGEPDCEDVTVANVLPDNSCLRDMKKALVHCTNKKNGCTHTFMLRELSTHKKICEFEFIPCLYASRGCAVKEFRGKLLKHQEECPFRPVNCKACHLEISHNQLQKHELEECPEQVTGCPYGCGDRKLKRKEQADHRNVCPVHPVDCTFSMLGCTFVGKRESVSAHEKEKLSFHMELVAQKCAELDIKNLDIHRNVQAIARERDELQQSMQSAQGQDQGIQRTLHQIETQTKDLRLKLVSLVERIIVLERKIPEFAEKRRVDELDRSLSAVQGRLTQLEQRQQMTGSGGNVGGQVMVAQYGTVNDMAAAFSTQLTAHDRQLGVHDVRMAEMDLRFQLLETASYDGTLVWKIRDYERRKRDAVSGRTLSLYSQPFYSSRFGYKMCARVYLNGDGMGKTTHMSLFFVIMRGEYDALLIWPFRQKVTMTLLDQSPEKRHLTDHFQPDPSSSSFQKPTSEMNVASGCPLFVSHSVMENPANGYLKEDTIFIRIVVDMVQNPAVF